MKVLLGWELGDGQGHIQRLVTLAKALQSHGCEPVFALKRYDLRNLQFPWQMLEVPFLPFLGRENSYTFADILETFGFANPQLLSAHLQSWQSILKTVQPQLVIADHAPGLVLAARNLVPTVVVGSHFAVPPPVEAFPSFRFPAPPESQTRQAQVSETVQKIAKTDLPLGQLLNGDCSFIFSLPELDYYRCWRVNPRYIGIQLAPLSSGNPRINASPWAYLNANYPYSDLVLQTLKPANDFKPLQEALMDRSIVVHHGGLTTSIACLLAGVPQLVLPRYLEQELNAIALVQLGVAQIMMAPTWESLVMSQAQHATLIENATIQSKSLAQWNHNFTNNVVNACLRFLV